MARQQANARLQTVEARRALPVRHDAYWHEVRRGLHLGLRKGARHPTWWLREYRDGRYWKRRLGLADTPDVPRDGVAVLSWTDALKIALGEERPTAMATDAYTLDQALDDYFLHRQAKSAAILIDNERAKAASAVPARLRGTDIAALTTRDLMRWRDQLVEQTDDRELKRRSQATANRTWSIVRASLNYAYATGRVATDGAWRRIRPFKNVDRPRTRFLQVSEAKRLLAKLPQDFARLARGALYTGLRLGELVELKVAQLQDGQIRVVHSKGGRERTVPMNKEGRAFFTSLTSGKAAGDTVFVRADGRPWYRMEASRLMARACTKAKISPPATFHDLRRSYASLLINAGTDAEIIQELLGHSDMRMTRRAYAHLLNATVRKAVEKRLPSFGLDMK